LSKEIEPYFKYPGKRTEIAIAENPDTIMEIIQDYIDTKAEEEEIKIDVDEKRYKATITYNKQPASEELQPDPIVTTLKILRVDNDDVFILDFTRKSGDIMEYLTFYKDLDNQIKKKFGYLVEGEEEQ
jgi:hypothetical protein